MKSIIALLILLTVSYSVSGQKKVRKNDIDPVYGSADTTKDTLVTFSRTKNNYLGDKYIYGIPILNNRIYYSEIDTIKGSKDELYNRAKGVLSEWFPNFSNVLKLDDKDLGKLRVRGIFETPVVTKGIWANYYKFYVTLTLEIKEGRYKYEFADFIDVSNNMGLEINLTTEKRATKFRDLFAPYMEELISTLKAGMSPKSSETW